MFTDELFELYDKYERATHGKVREPEDLKRFLCNSPVYDPATDLEMANKPSVLEAD